MSRDALCNIMIVMRDSDGDEKTSETSWSNEDDAIDYAQSFSPSGNWLVVGYILNDGEFVAI